MSWVEPSAASGHLAFGVLAGFFDLCLEGRVGQESSLQFGDDDGWLQDERSVSFFVHEVALAGPTQGGAPAGVGVDDGRCHGFTIPTAPISHMGQMKGGLGGGRFVRGSAGTSPGFSRFVWGAGTQAYATSRSARRRSHRDTDMRSAFAAARTFSAVASPRTT